MARWFYGLNKRVMKATDRRFTRRIALLFTVGATLCRWSAQEALASDAQITSEFLKTYCVDCHQPPRPKAKVDLSAMLSLEGISEDVPTWLNVLARVEERDMPPEDEPQPSIEDRNAFVDSGEQLLREWLCAEGPQPGPPTLRRLNRSEYSASIRRLLDIHFDAGEALPDEGAGGEGFDNAAETLFISPIHGEKYFDAARAAVEYALADTRSNQRVLVAQPSDTLAPVQAADQVLARFLPRAFRRNVPEGERTDYLRLFEDTFEESGSYTDALRAPLEAALVSPNFLFVIEEPPATGGSMEPLTDYELATRLSLFLWGSIPDDTLLEVASKGQLSDPDTLRAQTERLLSERYDRENRNFAQNFVEQWLGTRALGREFRPDPSVGAYDSELEGGMKYEPVFFFQEILVKNRPLLDLIDADYTYANRRLARHYRIRGEFREQPKRVSLSGSERRGGVLTMASVLAVSSYPHRTSPVLRGAYILEKILGDPPPPPPPNVPELEESEPEGDTPRSLRERLEAHRENPNCAGCHQRMDPLGFAFENYDVLGRWRENESGAPIDASGSFSNGRQFADPVEFKQALLERKDQFVRHLTRKMLGYALARGLYPTDECAVDEIVADLQASEYRSHALVHGIVQSIPFRFKSFDTDTP